METEYRNTLKTDFKTELKTDLKTDEEIERETEEQYERDLQFFQEQLVYDKIQDCRDELMENKLIFDYLRYVDINTLIYVIYDSFDETKLTGIIDPELNEDTLCDYELLISTVLDTNPKYLELSETQVNYIHNRLSAMV